MVDLKKLECTIAQFLIRIHPPTHLSEMAAATKGQEDSFPEVIRDVSEMRSWSRSRKWREHPPKTLALVPTMGFLHEGHLSLVRQAKSLADIIVVSIYVNPGQFAPTEDLSTYPSDFHGDLKKLADIGGVHAVFSPNNLYDYGQKPIGGGGDDDGSKKIMSCVEKGEDGGGHETWIRVERLEKGLCGKSRPVFFRGVATVVTKLFHIVEPDFALFGKKDYQQWRVISRMVRFCKFHSFRYDLLRERLNLQYNINFHTLALGEMIKSPPG